MKTKKSKPNKDVIYYKQELFSLQFKPYIPKIRYKNFLRHIKSGKPLTRNQDPFNHFCVFFAPFYPKSQEVFLVHHKKANDWIPPGGHLEEGEHPKKTVLRECFEELKYQPKNKDIQLFNIFKKNLSTDGISHIHNDFWYRVECSQKYNFNFDSREFYDGKWIKYSSLENYTRKNKDFLAILKTIIL